MNLVVKKDIKFRKEGIDEFLRMAKEGNSIFDKNLLVIAKVFECNVLFNVNIIL